MAGSFCTQPLITPSQKSQLIHITKQPQKKKNKFSRLLNSF